jgi:hypothetical protein
MPIKPTPINLPHFQKKNLYSITHTKWWKLEFEKSYIWNLEKINPIVSHHSSNVDFNVANLLYFVPKHIYILNVLKFYLHYNLFFLKKLYNKIFFKCV